MGDERHVRIFRNGRSRAIRIPKEWDFPGDEAIISKEGDHLVVKPAASQHTRLLALLEKWREEGPIEDEPDPFDFEDPPPPPVDL